MLTCISSMLLIFICGTPPIPMGAGAVFLAGGSWPWRPCYLQARVVSAARSATGSCRKTDERRHGDIEFTRQWAELFFNSERQPGRRIQSQFGCRSGCK
jgi:hypothetical protein